MNTLALRCSGLVHVYRVSGTDVAALRGVDLEIEPGQSVAVLGPSGSGKSTLLQIVAGIMRPSAGRVEVFGKDLATASRREIDRIRARSLGILLQGSASNLLLHETATENVGVRGHGAGRAGIGACRARLGGTGRRPSADRRISAPASSRSSLSRSR